MHLLIQFFTDPVLRAPTLGCMLMAMAASLVGVIAFVRRRSLLGETLSHAAYPGVIIAVALGATFLSVESHWMAPLVLLFAFLSALVGLRVVEWLQHSLKIRQDAALCMVLATFFGVGLTLASRIQFTHPIAYRRTEIYLYGQAATMTDMHIYLYGGLTLFVGAMLLLFFKEILITSFDREYARSVGVKTRFVEGLLSTLMALAVIIGIRSVGVVLMSAMLVAPPAAARQYSQRLPVILVVAALFGALSGFLGNFLSVVVSDGVLAHYPGTRLSLPTGPMIVIVASGICLFSLLFAPKRGVLLRLMRIARFRVACVQENILKSMWRLGSHESIPLGVLAKRQSFKKGYVRFLLLGLRRHGLVEQESSTCYRLTAKGNKRAEHIVRLHRLWEVYLVEHLGLGAERVHRSAEQMEHILTPELETALTHLLDDPREDPHQQPIPRGGVLV